MLVTGAVAALCCAALASLPAAAGFGRAEIHARWTCSYVPSGPVETRRVKIVVELSNLGDVRGSGVLHAAWFVQGRAVVVDRPFSLGPAATARRTVVLRPPAAAPAKLPPLTTRSCVVKLLRVRAGR